MTLYVTIDLPEDTTHTDHCPDLRELAKLVEVKLLELLCRNLKFYELPKVTVSAFDPAPICGACAAPLLHTGKCSSVNCKFGRVNQRKPARAQGRMIPERLLKTPGLKVASQLSNKV